MTKKKTAKPRKSKEGKEVLVVDGSTVLEVENAPPPLADAVVPRGRKLTPDQVREIRVLIGKGRKASEIADLYGLHPSSVDDIKVRRTWASLD